MTGIPVLDRRDVERILKHLVHAEHREDVKVEVKYYVQFSLDDAFSAQTLVDPWQALPRQTARAIVKEAIKVLDAEEKKNEALQTLAGGHDENPPAAKADPAHGGQDLSPGLDDLKPAEAGVLGAGEIIDQNPHIEVNGVIL